MLDHSHYRQELQDFQNLHDTWMHESTLTPTSLSAQETEGESHYTFGGPINTQMFPPSHSHRMYTGFIPPSDAIQAELGPHPVGNPNGQTTTAPQKQHPITRIIQRVRAGRGGGGGISAQGARQIGQAPQLGNVPFSSQPAAGSSNPIAIVIFLGALGIGGYFLWHKLRKTKSEEKQLDEKGVIS